MPADLPRSPGGPARRRLARPPKLVGPRRTVSSARCLPPERSKSSSEAPRQRLDPQLARPELTSHSSSRAGTLRNGALAGSQSRRRPWTHRRHRPLQRRIAALGRNHSIRRRLLFSMAMASPILRDRAPIILKHKQLAPKTATSDTYSYAAAGNSTCTALETCSQSDQPIAKPPCFCITP